ncbi:MAG: hypothetical protein WDW38_007027 [Sanguina aurantia]
MQVYAAKDFTVNYYSTYKVVTRVPSNDTYVLYQCGTAAPTPGVSAGVPLVATTFSIPLQTIAVPDTTVLGFLTVRSPTFGHLLLCFAQPVLVCRIISTGCGEDYEYGTHVGANASVNAIFGDVTPAYNKTVVFRATSDPDALGRAEWVKFVSVFFNLELKANTIFQTISNGYTAVKQFSASYASSYVYRPYVAWLLYDSYNARVQMNWTPYKAQFTVDASGKMLNQSAVFAMVSGYAGVTQDAAHIYFANMADFTALHIALRGADFVVDETAYAGVPNPQVTISNFKMQYGFTANDNTSTYNFMAPARILRLDGTDNSNGGLGWFEEAVSRPDIVLADLSFALLGTSAGLTSYKPVFVKALSSFNRVVILSASACPALTCSLPITPICPPIFRGCGTVPTLYTASFSCDTTCPAPPPHHHPQCLPHRPQACTPRSLQPSWPWHSLPHSRRCCEQAHTSDRPPQRRVV